MRALFLSVGLLALPSVAVAQTQYQVQAPWPTLPPPPPAGGGYVAQPTYAPVAPVQAPMQLAYNPVYGPEEDSSSARMQLALGQALNGAGIGLSLAALFRSESPGVYSGALLLGAGVGAAAAVIATRDGVTQGQASAVNNGTILGGLAATFLLFGANANLSSQTVAGIVAGGLTLGTAGGIVAATRRPLSGNVEFATSVGLWGAFLSTHLYLGTRGYGSFDTDSSEAALRVFGLTSFAALGAGVTVGALLSPSVHVSATRVRWINLSGLFGYTVVGLSSLLFASSEGGSTALTAYGLGSIAGAGLGIALGVLVTSDTDAMWESGRRAPQARRSDVMLVPGGPAGSFGASLGGSF